MMNYFAPLPLFPPVQILRSRRKIRTLIAVNSFAGCAVVQVTNYVGVLNL